MNLSNGRPDKWDAGERAEKAEATGTYNTQSKETTMFKRITLAALASTAILTSAALSPASAGHPVMGGMHHPGGFFGPHMRVGGMSHPGGFDHQRWNHWPRGPIAHGPFPHHPHWHWHWRHGVYGPVFVDQGYVAPAYATSAPAPVATCPSNCLAKQYLQDGSVLFTDQCTNESATAPAGSHG